MAATLIKQGESISVIDYRCTAGPGDAPFVESHASYSVSYVRKGTFGCITHGKSFELVAGSKRRMTDAAPSGSPTFCRTKRRYRWPP